MLARRGGLGKPNQNMRTARPTSPTANATMTGRGYVTLQSSATVDYYSFVPMLACCQFYHVLSDSS